MNINEGVQYEYEGTVTQLAATSEIATIGIKFTIPVGERVLILGGTLIMDDLSGDKTARHAFLQTSANSAKFLHIIQSLGMDNENLPLLIGNYADKSAAGESGQGLPSFPYAMGGGQVVEITTRSTITAEKTAIILLNYISRIEKMVPLVIGAGIAITNQVHKSV